MNRTNPPLRTWVILKHPAFVGEGANFAFLTCASDFDPGQDFFIALFFHGFDKPIETQVEEHNLVNQVARARRNCVLVCPRISLDDGSGDNPGLFRDEAQVEAFLGELHKHIRTLTNCDDPAALQARAAKAPLVLAAFGGGHSMASQMLLHDVSSARTECCAFFDSLYASDFYFRKPEEVLRKAALVGVHRAGYDGTAGSHEHNKHTDLNDRLAVRQIAVATSLDQVQQLRAGVAVLQTVDGIDHWDIVSRGSPLEKILSKFETRDGQSYRLPAAPGV